MRSGRKLSRIFVPVILLAILGLAWLNHQNIYDWWRLRGYNPPAAVAALASADSMNSKATHIFYVNHPRLIGNSANFRSQCSANEQTIILGCYHPDQLGIYVYDVKDQRLSGIEEVTAAHEMLHAAYDRLSGKDKANVDKMLQDFYKNGLNDQRIKDTIESYKETEPNDLVNEMHSIFGTEVTNLPAPLESYYKRYFDNRSAVVTFSEKYEAEFTSRKSRADQIESQLKSLKVKVDNEEANLNAQRSKINSDQSRLDSLRSSGRTSEYNSQVSAYNAEVDDYNAGVATYKADISRYNALVAEYNSIAGELNQLYGAIDTRLQSESTR